MAAILSFGSQSLTGKIKSGGPITLEEDALGNPVVEMKIPGYERVGFRPEGCREMSAMLRTGPSGDDPSQVARDTRSYDADGVLSFRLSHAARSRTLSCSPEDRAELADLFDQIADRLDSMLDNGEQDSEGDAADE